MFDRREKNAEIFQDTVRKYRTDNELKDAIKKSIANQIFIGADESYEIKEGAKKAGEVSCRLFASGGETHVPLGSAGISPVQRKKRQPELADGRTCGFAGGAAGVVNNFTQNNYSPKALSRLEIYRQSKNLLGYAGGGR